MLEVFYDILLNGSSFALVSVFVLRLFNRQYKFNQIWWIASLLALIVSVLILSTEYSLHLERQVNGILAGMAVAGFILLAIAMPHSGFLRHPRKKEGEIGTLLTGSGLFLIASWGLTHILRVCMFLIRRSSESVGGIDQGLLERWLGLSLGLLLLLFMCNAIYQSMEKLEDKKLKTFIYFFLALLFVKNGIEFMYGLLILKLYNPNDFFYNIIVRHMNSPETSLVLLLGIGVIISLVSLSKFKLPVPREDENPAQRRKKRATVIKKRNANRWMFLSLVLILGLGGIGYVATHTEKEIRPSTEITIDSKGTFTVAKEDLEDGHIHRYSWKSPDGVKIIFWLIKKRENNYGIVFDGCEICGPSGYIEKGDDVVCIACDVVMNRNTIGLKGGCNPIPIGNFIDNGDSITIKVEDLLFREDFFRGLGI